MLPFDRKPWARQLATTVIIVTVCAALIAPIYLHHIRHLDPPMMVLIVLLVLAIVPPNIAILRRRGKGEHPQLPAAAAQTAYAARTSGR